MEILEKGAIDRALNVEKKTPHEEKCRTIYNIIEGNYFNESKVKFPK